MVKTPFSNFDHRRHLRVMMSIVGSVFTALLLLNLLVDPYGAFRLVGNHSFFRFKDGLSTRIGKAESLTHGDWDVVLLGNSRAEIGLDPQHPAWGSRIAYNAGIAGTNFNELNLAAHLAMRERKLRLLVLCLDVWDFVPQPAEDDYLHSRLNPQLNIVEYYLANLLSQRTTEKSFDSIRNALKDQPGHDWRNGINEVPIKTHGASDWALADYHNYFAHEGPVISLSIDPARLTALENLLTEASQNGIRVQLVELPVHAIAFQRVFLEGHWELQEQWIRDVVEIVHRHNQAYPNSPVEFWDFSTYSEFALEPTPAAGETTTNMRWFWDAVHFKKALGDFVIDRITRFPVPKDVNLQNFGVMLNPDNVDLQLAKIRKDHAAWVERTATVKSSK